MQVEEALIIQAYLNRFWVFLQNWREILKVFFNDSRLAPILVSNYNISYLELVSVKIHPRLFTRYLQVGLTEPKKMQKNVEE